MMQAARHAPGGRDEPDPLPRRQRLVRHGHLPEREIVTGVGPVAVRCPPVRDRSGEASPERVRFSSAILPPYARRWLHAPNGSTSKNKEQAKAATEIRRMHATVVPSHFLLSGPPAWPTHCAARRGTIIRDSVIE
jgi:hypothetical protein